MRLLVNDYKSKQLFIKYVYLMFMLLFPFYTYSTPVIGHFYLPFPNRFWPNTAAPSIGTLATGAGNQIQMNTAANNPDVFCEASGSGYRVPSVAEYSTAFRSYRTGLSNSVPRNFNDLVPNPAFHWSKYSGENLLPDISGRVVSGGLVNEWGNLSVYNGWEVSLNNGLYLTVEPAIIADNTLLYGQRWIGWGRQYVYITNGAWSSPTGLSPGVQASPTNSNVNVSRGYLACVRDLIITPATANPGKT